MERIYKLHYNLGKASPQVVPRVWSAGGVLFPSKSAFPSGRSIISVGNIVNFLFLVVVMIPVGVFGQITIKEHPTRIIPTKEGIGEPVTCMNGDAEAFLYEDPGRIALSDVVPHCLDIYVETDSFTVAQFGSIGAVQDWINKIEQNVKIIYENEGIHIRFVEVYIPSHREWSDGLTSVNAILTQFGLVRKISPGDVKHFITLRPLGGGVAWVNMLCKQSPSGSSWGPFAVSAHMSKTFPDYPSYSWNINVFCHETGHVIGSQHTHACVWGPNQDMRIDDCSNSGTCSLIEPVEYSTIMSYCHLTSHGIDFTRGFGALPGDLLRARINTAGCLGSGVNKIGLLGDTQGTFYADTIYLAGVHNTGNLILHANVVEISGSDLFPIFEINSLSCPVP